MQKDISQELLVKTPCLETSNKATFAVSHVGSVGTDLTLI